MSGYEMTRRPPTPQLTPAEMVVAGADFIRNNAPLFRGAWNIGRQVANSMPHRPLRSERSRQLRAERPAASMPFQMPSGRLFPRTLLAGKKFNVWIYSPSLRYRFSCYCW